MDQQHNTWPLRRNRSRWVGIKPSWWKANSLQGVIKDLLWESCSEGVRTDEEDTDKGQRGCMERTFQKVQHVQGHKTMKHPRIWKQLQVLWRCSFYRTQGEKWGSKRSESVAGLRCAGAWILFSRQQASVEGWLTSLFENLTKLWPHLLQ